MSGAAPRRPEEHTPPNPSSAVCLREASKTFSNSSSSSVSRLRVLFRWEGKETRTKEERQLLVGHTRFLVLPSHYIRLPCCHSSSTRFTTFSLRLRRTKHHHIRSVDGQGISLQHTRSFLQHHTTRPGRRLPHSLESRTCLGNQSLTPAGRTRIIPGRKEATRHRPHRRGIAGPQDRRTASRLRYIDPRDHMLTSRIIYDDGPPPRDFAPDNR